MQLSRQFVCLRLVRMNGVDLRQFQFDYDQTWAAMFLNADGTVYARYGSRSPVGPMELNSAEGLIATLKSVLRAHKAYPANRELFAGKRGPDPGVGRPEELPGLRRGGGRRGLGDCIHCHNVQEGFHAREMQRGKTLPSVVFKYPFPENIGVRFELDGTQGLREVLPNSAAARAGLAAGDVLLTLNGQAIFSIADVQFVLHHLRGESVRLVASLQRGKERLQKTLMLEGRWRHNDFTWRVSMNGVPPDLGLYLRTLEPDEKAELGVASDEVALEVVGMFRERLRRAGLREGDTVVGYDGRTAALGAPAFKRYLRLWHHRAGTMLRLEVLRKSKRLSLSVQPWGDAGAEAGSESN